MSAPESEVQKLNRNLEDAIVWPFPTREIETDYSATNGDASASGGNLNHLAQQTIRRVLGWRHREGDAKGFTAALGKAFTLKDVDGHTEWEWKPQAYTLQADLGEITGAQASVHSQASLILEQAIKLLDGLEPLRSDPDEEDTEAIRAIIRSELLALTEELGLRGGPRVPRVDLILEQLLTKIPGTNAQNVGGQLGVLRNRFGLTANRVNTIEEEQNLTNFMILVDHVLSVENTWQANRDHFLSSQASPFLGTHLVRISQDLEVVVENVHEANVLMDSVLLGDSERQATLVDFPGDTRMSIGELLGWTESFATSEGPELLRTSGRDGAATFAQTSNQLHVLMKALSDLLDTEAGKPHSDLPRGLLAKRVRVAIANIDVVLKRVSELAAELKRSNGHWHAHPGEAPATPDASDTSDFGFVERWVTAHEPVNHPAATELFWKSVPKLTADENRKVQFKFQQKHKTIRDAALYFEGVNYAKYVPNPTDSGAEAKFHTVALRVVKKVPTAALTLCYIADGGAFFVRNAVQIKPEGK